jgi:hypothetical protein
MSKIYSLTVLEPRSPNWYLRCKNLGIDSPILTSCFFQLPWLIDPSSPFKEHCSNHCWRGWGGGHCIPFSSFVVKFPSDPLTLFNKNSVITCRAQLDNLAYFPHLKTFSIVTTVRSLLLGNMFLIPGIGPWCFGGCYSVHHTPFLPPRLY